MNPDKVYDLIKTMKDTRRVNADGFFYGLNEKHEVQYLYSFEGGLSGINLVCPKDLNGDFFLVEISDLKMLFTKIQENGMKSTVMDLSTSDSFFQADTVTDLVMSFNEYQELYKAFRKYYCGFLHHLTIYV